MIGLEEFHDQDVAWDDGIIDDADADDANDAMDEAAFLEFLNGITIDEVLASLTRHHLRTRLLEPLRQFDTLTELKTFLLISSPYSLGDWEESTTDLT